MDRNEFKMLRLEERCKTLEKEIEGLVKCQDELIKIVKTLSEMVMTNAKSISCITEIFSEE